MYKQLFYKRLFYEWRQKWQTVRSIVDWTVALYFVIPVIVFASMYHASLWKTPPEWIHYVALPTVFTLLFFLTTFGSVRSFLEQGDSLFLIQYPDFLRSIMRRGMWYTFIKVCLLNGALFIYGLPILLKGYSLTAVQIVVLFVFLTLMSYIQLFLNRYWAVHIQKRWKQLLVHLTSRGIAMLVFTTGVFLLVNLPYMILLYGFLLGSFLLYIIRKKLQYQRFFFQEAEQERTEAMRWTSTVMVRAGHVQKPVQAKRPWLFPRSKRLGKSDSKTFRIAEAFTKDYFRTNTNLQFYFLIASYSSAVLYVAPWWMSLIVISFALFALFQQLGEQWKTFADKMFLRLYCQKGELLLIAEKARVLLFLPVLLLYGVVGVGVINIWLGMGLALLIMGFGIRYALLP